MLGVSVPCHTYVHHTYTHMHTNGHTHLTHTTYLQHIITDTTTTQHTYCTHVPTHTCMHTHYIYPLHAQCTHTPGMCAHTTHSAHTYTCVYIHIPDVANIVIRNSVPDPRLQGDDHCSPALQELSPSCGDRALGGCQSRPRPEE